MPTNRKKSASPEGKRLKEVRTKFFRLGLRPFALACGMNYGTYYSQEARGVSLNEQVLRAGFVSVLGRAEGADPVPRGEVLGVYVFKGGTPPWEGEDPFWGAPLEWRVGQSPVARAGRKPKSAGGAIVPALSTPTPPAQPIVFASLVEDLEQIESIATSAEREEDPSVMRATFRTIRKLAFASRAELATSGSAALALTTPSGLEPERWAETPRRPIRSVRASLSILRGQNAA